MDFSGDVVDPATGAIAMRARIPNPDKRLLPGTYVTLKATLGEQAMPISCRRPACSAMPRAPSCWWSATTARSRARTSSPIACRAATGWSATAWPPATRSSCPASSARSRASRRRPRRGSRRTRKPPTDAEDPAPSAAPPRQERAERPEGLTAMSRFFINHPVFAWVIAILISLVRRAGDPQPRRRVVSEHRAAAGRRYPRRTRAPAPKRPRARSRR